MKRFFWIITLILVLSTPFIFAQDGLAVATVSAQGSTPTDDQVNAIAKQLYCPVCENTPLDVCPTQACKEWREEIRGLLADGKSEAEIKQHFVDYYGARVLAEPPRTGFNWLIYVVPPIVIVAGVFVLFRAFKAWSQPAASETEAGMDEVEAVPSSDDEYIARMEEELKKRN
jgi:cytochrome c-type biogenesis protein CcmH